MLTYTKNKDFLMPVHLSWKNLILQDNIPPTLGKGSYLCYYLARKATISTLKENTVVF